MATHGGLRRRADYSPEIDEGSRFLIKGPQHVGVQRYGEKRQRKRSSSHPRRSPFLDFGDRSDPAVYINGQVVCQKILT
jgi:hypothetical protein